MNILEHPELRLIRERQMLQDMVDAGCVESTTIAQQAEVADAEDNAIDRRVEMGLI